MGNQSPSCREEGLGHVARGGQRGLGCRKRVLQLCLLQPPGLRPPGRRRRRSRALWPEGCAGAVGAAAEPGVMLDVCCVGSSRHHLQHCGTAPGSARVGTATSS